MGYQRAKWHSGLTYQQVCATCKRTFRYTDHALGFRPWYADGYVDCPTCGTHMRHNERYALGPDGKPQPEPQPREASVNAPSVAPGKAFASAFCHNCGNKFDDAHRFCCKCGAKRF